MCQFRFDIWNLQNCKDHPQILQLCRGSAEIDCPGIGTCRNVGSNLGRSLHHDSDNEIVQEIWLGKCEATSAPRNCACRSLSFGPRL